MCHQFLALCFSVISISCSHWEFPCHIKAIRCTLPVTTLTVFLVLFFVRLCCGQCSLSLICTHPQSHDLFGSVLFHSYPGWCSVCYVLCCVEYAYHQHPRPISIDNVRKASASVNNVPKDKVFVDNVLEGKSHCRYCPEGVNRCRESWERQSTLSGWKDPP